MTNETKIDTSTAATLDAAIGAMNEGRVFDVTIICTTDDHQALYWTKRLSEGVCATKTPSSSESKSGRSVFPLVIGVSEDWNSGGGAGNGLGTLYAYTKACKVASSQHGVDIPTLLADGQVSAAIYHTAGKGTRLAPLPASENNNKPGVKLPFCHTLSDGSLEPITVLEAVVKQTGVYASSRSGRLSVFWGDQVFIPSAPFTYTPTHHADILCTLLGETAPSAAQWEEQGLDKYGVIAVSSSPTQNAAQVEKVDHATALRMLAQLGEVGGVGPSLGSFSMSSCLLEALCEEFQSELEKKMGKLDTDPHFWMPMTLAVNDYVGLMNTKGVSPEESLQHHQRMAAMLERFQTNDKNNKGGLKGLFGAVDVGQKSCWWDYGQLKYYYDYNMKLLDDDAESEFLRKFLGVTSRRMDSTLAEDVIVDESSCVFGSTIGGGADAFKSNIQHSVLASVTASQVVAEDAIIVNCVAKTIRAGKGSILYNLVTTEDLVAEDGDVRVAVTSADGDTQTLTSKRDICGGKAWKQVVCGNDLSFEAVHAKNKMADVGAIEQIKRELYRKASSSLLNEAQ